MRYQELLFCASVLGAAIALHNCRHQGEYALRTVDFPARNLRPLPGAAPTRAAPACVSFARRRSPVRLSVVDTHEVEAVRAVRTPSMVRREPYISIIVRLLFVIPAERI